MDITGGLVLLGMAGILIVAILAVLHSIWCVIYSRNQWPIDRRFNDITRR